MKYSVLLCIMIILHSSLTYSQEDNSDFVRLDSSNFAHEDSIDIKDYLYDNSDFVRLDSCNFVYQDSLDKKFYWYDNCELGIKFGYYQFDYSPIFPCDASYNLSDWQEYYSEHYNLKFLYPKEYILNIGSSENLSWTTYDSTIQLGYKYLSGYSRAFSKEDSTSPDFDSLIMEYAIYYFTPQIQIYLTEKDFNEIAREHYFAQESVSDSVQDSLITTKNWITTAYGASPNEADFLNGYEWKGVRNENAFFERYFLCRKYSGRYYLVVSFFVGRGGNYWIINEHLFYKIVNSIKLLR